MAKHAEWAAAISSSGLVTPFASSAERAGNETSNVASFELVEVDLARSLLEGAGPGGASGTGGHAVSCAGGRCPEGNSRAARVIPPEVRGVGPPGRRRAVRSVVGGLRSLLRKLLVADGTRHRRRPDRVDEVEESPAEKLSAMQRIAKNRKMFAMVRFDMRHVLVGIRPPYD